MKIIASKLITNDEKIKQYKVLNGVFYIDHEAIEITGDEIVSWDVSDDEDFDFIRRNKDTNEIELGVVFFVSTSTSEEVFTHEEDITTNKVSPTKGFTLYEDETNGIVCDAYIEDLEGMEW